MENKSSKGSFSQKYILNVGKVKSYIFSSYKR